METHQKEDGLLSPVTIQESQLLEPIQKQECRSIWPPQSLGFTHVSTRGQLIISLSFSFVFSRIFLENELNALQEVKAVKYSVVWSQ